MKSKNARIRQELKSRKVTMKRLASEMRIPYCRMSTFLSRFELAENEQEKIIEKIKEIEKSKLL